MNAVAFHQESRRILGICPCCGELFRLSEVQLFTRQAPPRTQFDQIDDERRRFERTVERYEVREAALREKAMAKGQAAAHKRLKGIAGPFIQRKIKPQDVKVLFDPIEFIAFRGMTAGRVTKIAFIDRPARSKAQEAIQTSIAKVVKAGNYEWKVLRVGQDGRVEDEG